MKKRINVFIGIITIMLFCTGCKEQIENVKNEIIPKDESRSEVERTQEVILDNDAEKYQQAKSYYEKESYEIAQSLFIDLGDYEDAREYVLEIAQIFYDQALESFRQKEYEECVFITENIDTKEKWENYTVALDLRDNAIEAYSDMIADEAESLYIKEGSKASNRYIESMICTIFLQEDAKKLAEKVKEKCNTTELSECTLIDHKTLRSNTVHNVKDIFGNEYEYGIVYDQTYIFNYTEMSCGETTETYYINEEYKHFSTSIVPYEEVRNSADFIIYADGKRIYSCVVDTKSRPKEIELDVSGVEELTICFIDGYDSKFLLCNPRLYREY